MEEKKTEINVIAAEHSAGVPLQSGGGTGPDALWSSPADAPGHLSPYHLLLHSTEVPVRLCFGLQRFFDAIGKNKEYRRVVEV